MSLLKFVFVFGVLAVSLRNVLAVSSEEKQKIHEDSFRNIEKCSAELGFTLDDMKKVEKSDFYDTLDPCVVACLFRKTYMIDDQGLFNVSKAEEFIYKYLSDEADLKKARGIISNCKTVNGHEVTDGAKGCERAKMLLQCFGPLKAMFDN